MFCQKCGNQFADELSNCPFCGASASSGQQPLEGNTTVLGQQPAMQQPVQQPVSMGQQPVQQPAYNSAGAPNPYAQPYPMQAPPAKKKSKAGIIIGVVIAVIAIIAVIAVVIISGNKPEKKFYGEWTVTLDYTQKVKDSEGEIKDYLGDDFKCAFDAKVLFNKDGTYSITVDDNAIQQLKDSLKKPLEKAFCAYMRGQYSSVSQYTDEQIIQAYESGAGQSMDALLTQVIDEMKLETIAKRDFEGNYKVDKEHFYLSASKDHAVDETEYAVYTLKDNDTIEVTDYILDGKSNDTIFSLPCTLEKVK